MVDLGPAPTAMSEDAIIRYYGRALTRMVREEIDQDLEPERETQVAEALRNLLYWEGKQYVVPQLDAAEGTISIVPLADDQGREKFSSVYNVYRSDGLKFVGAIGSRAPNCKAVADNDESEEQVQRAAQANAVLRDLFRKWDADAKTKELVQNAWNTGPTFLYTPFVSDGHRYGYVEEPVIEVVEDESLGEALPVPRVTSTRRYPNGDVELYLLDSRYVTIPYKAKSLDECEYLCYEYLEHKAVLKSMFRGKLDDASTDDDAITAGKDAALEAQERSNTPSGRERDRWKQNRWRFSRYWIRPSYFHLIEGTARDAEGDELQNTGGRRVTIGEQLEEQFPEGLKVTLVNGRIVDIEHERMDDVWAVCKPGTGGRILSKPWGNASIPIQDDLNDFMNMLRENVLRHNVQVAVESSLFDWEVMREQANKVLQYLPVRLEGQDIDKKIKAIPGSSMPNDAVALIDLGCIRLRREASGVTEALGGMGQPAATYRAEKQRRDQSMMHFAPLFTEIQSAWEKAATNGIRQRARYSSRVINVPGEDGIGSVEVDLALLQELGWHVEAEEGIPMSFAEEADALRFLTSVESNPQVAENLGLWEPWNRERVSQKLGIRGVTSGIENDKKKVRKIIRRLLATPMEPGEIDPQTGEQMPPLPAIKPEPGIEDHSLYAGLVAFWCNSPEGQVQADVNPEGYQHVVAYFEAQRSAAAAAQQPSAETDGDSAVSAPPQESMPGPEAVASPPPSNLPFNTAPPEV